MPRRPVLSLTLLLTFTLVVGNVLVSAQQTPPPATPTDPPTQDCKVILGSPMATDVSISLVQLSPDGKQLLLQVPFGLDVINADGTNQHLLVRIMPSFVRVEGLPALNLTMDTTPNIVSVAWSPDGNYIAYSTVQPIADGPPPFRNLSKLYVIKASGPDAGAVVFEKDMPLPEPTGTVGGEFPLYPAYSISWSSDSRYFIFLLQTQVSQSDLDIISISDASQTTLAQNVGLALWLVQSDRIAYVQTSLSEGANGGITIIDLKGNVVANIATDFQAIFSIAWSNNQQQIALAGFKVDDPDRNAGPSRPKLFVVNADGSALHYLQQRTVRVSY